MALVRIEWTETRQYAAEVEIHGYEGTDDEVKEAIGDLSSENHDDAQLDGTEITIDSVITERAGDEPIKVTVAAKQHEDMF
ncbi:hypothetical protein SEA_DANIELLEIGNACE_70 [Arthrobacter phage DanielleIgnace]|nr:hypothetical protein SEA_DANIELLEIGNACE_70 [Arthrobacter phage DanielleIgnace]